MEDAIAGLSADEDINSIGIFLEAEVDVAFFLIISGAQGV